MITTTDVRILNKARRVLTRLADEAGTASWQTPAGYNGGAANAGDYARVAVLADVAEDAIFAVLNTANSHRVVRLHHQQMILSRS